MKSGGVKLQVLAIYTDSLKGSSDKGVEQSKIFGKLLTKYSDQYRSFPSSSDLNLLEKIIIVSAIENASAFCSEDESLEEGIRNFEKIERLADKPLYVSLTHSEENRFGGPSLLFSSSPDPGIGLKNDGKFILDFLNEKKIAIDLSHASNQLAHDILDYTQQNNLDTPIIISHTAFRSICDIQRNMPDEILKEVIARKGIIGLNMLRPFLGPEDQSNIVKQVDYILGLGGKKNFGFGCDFFCDVDVGEKYRSKNPEAFFFPGFDNSSMYPRMIDLLRNELKLSDEVLKDIAYRNVIRFLSP
jgi:microsomal dipeptidase-like Zn-dependent dipeptidase